MATYFIWTVGCQMNKADSDRLAGQLEALGLGAAETVEGADLVVVNSCSVRQSAEQHVLGKLGYLKGLRRRKPELMIALTGCMVPPENGDLRHRLPFVDYFLPPLQWDALLLATRERLATGDGADAAAACGATEGEVRLLPEGRDAVSRFVPIIYGCNNFCTYCIVPYRRGRERSRPPAEIVAEVKAVVAQGAREVTLLGQNVDSYGHDLPGKLDLADLLAQVGDVKGLWRLRFLTSHPKDMSERLVDAVASLPKVCEHINLPIQAGSDRVLQAMHRGYTVERYLDTVQRMRTGIDGVALSTDLIVGFPGETAEEFQGSYKVLEQVRFDVVHAAKYSPRPGTVAARLPDDVPAVEKKQRLDAVEKLQEGISLARHQALVGQEVEVLVERCARGKWEGRTRTDTLVFFVDHGDWRGHLARVLVTRAGAWSVQGEVQGQSQPPS